jgi:hypothetical protein
MSALVVLASYVAPYGYLRLAAFASGDAHADEVKR